jgi:uncharacterized glyoxalase superfamily protein PhnB
MDLQSMGFVILSENVKQASSFYTEVLGFKQLVAMDWYASHEHTEFEGVYLDIIKTDHEAAGKYLENHTTTGTMIALIVTDANKELSRIQKHGVDIIMKIQDEPWGQRRFQILGPDEVVIEVIERIPPDMEWLQANT